MADNNKRNLEYFEASSMRELFSAAQTWQERNNRRFLSLSVERDGDGFCCIALTNPTEVVIADGPTEVVIVDGTIASGADVTGGALKVAIHRD